MGLFFNKIRMYPPPSVEMLDRLTHHCDIIETETAAGASKPRRRSPHKPARSVAATPTGCHGASATARTRRGNGTLLDAISGAKFDADSHMWVQLEGVAPERSCPDPLIVDIPRLSIKRRGRGIRPKLVGRRNPISHLFADATRGNTLIGQATRFTSPMHKFEVGQIVEFRPQDRSGALSGPYLVTKQLPGSDHDPEYRIKSEREAHQRVARQSQLRAAGEQLVPTGSGVRSAPAARRVRLDSSL